MTESPLATLIHISDLHFGPVLKNKRRWFKRMLARTPFQGRYPHDYEAAVALSERIKQLLANRAERKIPAVVIHTGDLTRIGLAEEFDVGSTFLRKAHSIGTSGSGRSVGLELCDYNDASVGGTPSAARLFDIPGNHDFWQRMDTDQLGVFHDLFPGPYPIRHKIVTGSRPIIVYGLDSNRASKWQHRRANGAIDSLQLNQICKLLEEAQAGGAIQVVCLHHPLRKEGSGGELTLKLLGREGIAKRLVQAGADLVLAGHIHEYQNFPPEAALPLHVVAGTAAQMGAETRNFLLFDIYASRIDWLIYDHDDEARQFVPRYLSESRPLA